MGSYGGITDCVCPPGSYRDCLIGGKWPENGQELKNRCGLETNSTSVIGSNFCKRCTTGMNCIGKTLIVNTN